MQPLWSIMRKYKINANHVRAIEHLYEKAISAVQMKSRKGEWFRGAFGFRQGLLFSSTLFNIFLKRIMSDALEEHDAKVNIVSKLKLVRCLAISIFLSICESEILTAELEKRTQDFEMRCNRRLRTENVPQIDPSSHSTI